MTTILVTESEVRKSHQGRGVSGIRIIVSDDFQHLIRIENRRDGHNFTPWLRRTRSVFIEVPTHLRRKGERRLHATEFFDIVSAARAGKNLASVEVIVHALPQGYVVHIGAPGHFSGHRVLSDAELKSLLRRAERQFKRLHVTVISAFLRTLHVVYAALPAQGFVFGGEGGTRLAPGGARPLRSVLVLTNISGTALGYLEQNLPFWSKGIPGFRFRHLFGQLTARRVESTLLGREWDIVIYRGHSVATENGVVWKLADGDWLVPPAISPLYIHSACLPDSELLPLDKLPSERFVTPLTYLTDFDDSRLVRLLLERYKASGNVHSALRAAQAEYPRFALISM